MLYAIDKSGNRIKPKKKGKASCPYCKSKLVAICGDINVHHWRHEISAICDPWKDYETEWHRKWKTFFPEKWREVFIRNSDEIHIADVKTEKGLIVEFQNSSILKGTIEKRERFYKKMIWVINAQKFKQNFSIWSKVTLKLQELDEDYYHDYYDDEFDTKPFEEDLLEIKDEIKIKRNFIKELSDKIDTSKYYLDDIKNLTLQIMSGDYFSYKDPLYDFNSNFTKQIKTIDFKCKKLNEQLEKNKKKLDFIISFNNSILDEYKHYREVEFKYVKESSFNKCAVILKKEEKSLFPIITKLKNEHDFNWYFKKKNEYKLLIDLSEKEKELIKNIKYTNDELFVFQKTKLRNIIYLKYEIQDFLNSSIQIWENKYDETVLGVERLSEQYEIIEGKQVTQLNKEAERADEDYKKWQKKEKTIRKNIMINNKGLYDYHWKYKRKSWDYATKKIFLDFGDKIFEIVSDEVFKKISKDELITKIKNWR